MAVPAFSNMKITALKRHSYRNRSISVGETYEADDKFGPVLVAARVARYSDREMKPAAQVRVQYYPESIEKVSADMAAVSAALTPSNPAKPRTARKPKAN